MEQWEVLESKRDALRQVIKPHLRRLKPRHYVTYGDIGVNYRDHLDGSSCGFTTRRSNVFRKRTKTLAPVRATVRCSFRSFTALNCATTDRLENCAFLPLW